MTSPRSASPSVAAVATTPSMGCVAPAEASAAAPAMTAAPGPSWGALPSRAISLARLSTACLSSRISLLLASSTRAKSSHCFISHCPFWVSSVSMASKASNFTASLFSLSSASTSSLVAALTSLSFSSAARASLPFITALPARKPSLSFSAPPRLWLPGFAPAPRLLRSQPASVAPLPRCGAWCASGCPPPFSCFPWSG